VTSTAFPARARSAATVALPRADAIALGALTIFFVVLAALTWHTWGDLDSDTGYDVQAGLRVAHGELPYRDFTYYYGPLAPMLAGLFSLVGGGGIGSTAALGFLVSILIVAATFAAARIFVGTIGAFLAAAITTAVAFIPNNYGYVLPHTNAATLGTLFLLALVLAVHLYARTGAELWLVAAGVSVGATALTKPEPALAAFAALGLWMLLRRRDLHRRALALALGPALAIPALVYGAFLTVVSPHRLVLENLWPVDFLHAAGNTMVKARMPLTPSSFASVAGHTIAYAVGVAALVGAAMLLDRPRLRRPLIGALALFALGFAAVALVKPDGLRDGFYYLYGWIPVGAAAAVVLLLLRYRRTRTLSPADQPALVAAVVLALTAATTYSTFVFHGYRPQMAVYYAPFAAILLARLHLVELARRRTAYILGVAWVALIAASGAWLTIHDARAESVTVHGPGGALTAPAAEGRLYRAALAEISAHARPGDPIFVAPMMTGLYALSGHESPLRDISMLPGALAAPGGEHAAVVRLSQSKVPVVLIDHRTWKGYGQTEFGRSFDRELSAWIKRNYVHTGTLRSAGERPRTIDVYTRRGP
jgi:hypothetical protein